MGFPHTAAVLFCTTAATTGPGFVSPGATCNVTIDWEGPAETTARAIPTYLDQVNPSMDRTSPMYVTKSVHLGNQDLRGDTGGMHCVHPVPVVFRWAGAFMTCACSETHHVALFSFSLSLLPLSLPPPSPTHSHWPNRNFAAARGLVAGTVKARRSIRESEQARCKVGAVSAPLLSPTTFVCQISHKIICNVPVHLFLLLTLAWSC